MSIEQGPIARLIDDDKDGRYERRQPITTRDAELPGPLLHSGSSLRRGRRARRGRGSIGSTIPTSDGVFDKAELIRDANGGMGEHGPHAVMLGPDGRLYYNNGNHAHLKPPIDPASPVNVAYEGELLPHYNDSRGHAAGIMAPGGEIYRSDDDGQDLEAGRRRVPQRVRLRLQPRRRALHLRQRHGVGRRPALVSPGPRQPLPDPGAEFGWRNGSGKWPAYYFDSLPATLDVGRGSPTGVTFYQASQFPDEYRRPLPDLRLVAGPDPGGQAGSRRGDLQGEGRRAGHRPAAELHRHRGRPRRRRLLHDRRPGDAGRAVPRELDRPAARPSPHGRDPLDEAIEIDSPLSSFSPARSTRSGVSMPASWDQAAGPRWRATRSEIARAPRSRPRPARPSSAPSRASELLDRPGRRSRGRCPRPGRRACSACSRSSRRREALDAALADADPFVRRHACEGLMQQPAAPIPVAGCCPSWPTPTGGSASPPRVAIEHADLEPPSRPRSWACEDPRARVEGMLALVRATGSIEAGQDRAS